MFRALLLREFDWLIVIVIFSYFVFTFMEQFTKYEHSQSSLVLNIISESQDLESCYRFLIDSIVLYKVFRAPLSVKVTYKINRRWRLQSFTFRLYQVAVLVNTYSFHDLKLNFGSISISLKIWFVRYFHIHSPHTSFENLPYDSTLNFITQTFYVSR